MEDDILDEETSESTEEVSEVDGLPKQFIKSRFSLMTPEQRAEMGRKGGTKSGETRRNQKQMKEIFKMIASLPMKKGKKADVAMIKCLADMKGKNLDAQTIAALKMWQKSMGGDIQAFKLCLAMMDELPMGAVEESTIDNEIAAAQEIVFAVRRSPTNEDGVGNGKSTADDNSSENN